MSSKEDLQRERLKLATPPALTIERRGAFAGVNGNPKGPVTFWRPDQVIAISNVFPAANGTVAAMPELAALYLAGGGQVLMAGVNAAAVVDFLAANTSANIRT